MTSAAPAAGEKDLRANQILLVEDEVLIRLNVADELRIAGFTVLEASVPEEALKILFSSAEIGLVVTDIRMPGAMDGIALAEIVRRDYPHIKIAFLSGNIDTAANVDVDALFYKPVRVEMLLSRVRQLLGGSGRPELASS